MKILFTFPGQGTQHEGMLQNLPGTELEQARAVLGAEVDTLDSEGALTHTRAVQLSLLIAMTFHSFFHVFHSFFACSIHFRIRIAAFSRPMRSERSVSSPQSIPP